MRRLAILFLCLVAVPASAQDRPGLVARLIQDSLSGPGRTVQVSGFSGVLSGAARMDRMTFADDDGIWLTLEGVVLDWDRAALFRGALSVEELSATTLTVARLPNPAPSTLPDAPAAEASGFKIPELPVSVTLGRVAIDRTDLGAPVLGQAASLRLDGSATLADGGGAIDLALERLDGPADGIVLAAGFDGATQGLSLDLAVTEAAGGLIGTLLDIPGTPALDLTVLGGGPLDDFSSDITLASDGVKRVSGQVVLTGTGAATAFRAVLAGDVTPLLAPEARAFLGPDVSFTAEGRRGADGALSLSTLDLTAQSLRFAGQVEIAADGLPQSFDLTGALVPPASGRLALPGASDLTIAGGTFDAQFDAAQGDRWALELDLETAAFQTYAVQRLGLGGGGTIQRGATPKVTADLILRAAGLQTEDPALAESLGSDLGGNVVLTWQQGAPLVLDRLTLGGDTYGLEGRGSAEFGDRTLLVGGAATVFADDLARFSPIAGRDLAGRLRASLEGSGDVLGGIFDATVDLDGDGVRLGDEIADRMLEGPVRFDSRVRRDTTGTYLDAFDLRSTGVTATGGGAVGPVGSALELTARLTDVGLIAPDYSGPLEITGTVGEPAADRFAVDVALSGPYGLTGAVAGELGEAASQALRLDLALPDIAPLVPDHSGPLRVTGTAADRGQGTWDVDLDIGGPYQATVAVQGLIGNGLGDVALDARLPDLAPLVPDVPGPIQVTGRAQEQDGSRWRVDLDVAAPQSIRAAVEGTVGGGTSRVTLEAGLPDIAPFAPGYTGALALTGAAVETGEGRWTVNLDADGPYAIEAQIEGPVGDGRSLLSVAARLPDVAPLAPGVTGPVAVNGVLRQTDDGQWSVRADAGLPYRATAKVTGRVGDGRTEADVVLSLPDLRPVVPQLSGAAQVTARAAQDGEAWQIQAQATGPGASTARATARLTDRIEAEVSAQAPNLAVFAPGLRGGGTLTAVAARDTAGVWTADADVTGPYRSTAKIDVTFAPESQGTTAQISARMPDIGPLAPGLAGPLRFEARATQAGAEAYDITLDAGGPYASTARVNGRYAPGAGRFDLTLAVPNIAPLAPGLSGAVQVAGSAREDRAGWSLDLTSNGPGAATARVSGTTAPDLATVALRAAGSAPLALANQIIAPRQILGTATFDLALNGRPTLAALSGSVRAENARLALPTLSQTFSDIDVGVALSGGTARIEASASGGGGGRVRASGPIQLDGGLEAGVSVAFDNLVLEDPSLYTTRLGGGIKVTGPLARGALIDGRVRIGRTEIRLPSGGLGFGGNIPKMTHLNEPGSVFVTRQRARAVTQDTETASAQGGGAVHRLDLEIDAPNQIFVRGRGLDMELGGALLITGTTAQPIPVGGIDVIRGTLSILGRRLTISSDSRLTLAGDFTPVLDVSAETESDDLTVVIQVTGPVDAPEITFTSVPELPQDEVLARLLFGRGITDLSAFQAAQLAASVAELTGRSSGPGLLGGLREGLGLDDLDVRTTQDGTTEVTAGRYLSENIYTDVTTGGDGQSTIRLNIDLTDNVRVTGKATTDGDTSIGIFFERDY